MFTLVVGGKGHVIFVATSGRSVEAWIWWVVDILKEHHLKCKIIFDCGRPFSTHSVISGEPPPPIKLYFFTNSVSYTFFPHRNVQFLLVYRIILNFNVHRMGRQMVPRVKDNNSLAQGRPFLCRKLKTYITCHLSIVAGWKIADTTENTRHIINF